MMLSSWPSSLTLGCNTIVLIWNTGKYNDSKTCLTPSYAMPAIARHHTLLEKIDSIEQHEGGLDAFTKGYEQFGFNLRKDGIDYCEWAPNAREAYLIGDFSKSFNSFSLHPIPCLT